jgi:death-on-curing protein
MALFDSAREPMTSFGKHDRALLESALNNPRQTFGGVDLYPTISRKAAILYYGLIKNHPFDNGNKRTATATTMVFLYINNRWLSGSSKEVDNYLVELAKRVAASEGDSKRSEFLDEIDSWFLGHMVVRK